MSSGEGEYSNKQSQKSKEEKSTLMKRMRLFRDGLKKLWRDYLIHRHISDASINKQSSWRGVIPRRQQEHQRKLKRDLRKVFLPVAAYVLIPVAGNIFVLLALAMPQLFLSDHFLTPQQIVALSKFDYHNRRGGFCLVANDFWNTLMIRIDSSKGVSNKLNIQETDTAGPVFGNILPLYHLFHDEKHYYVGGQDKSLAGNAFLKPSKCSFPSSLSKLPRDQLINLAIASGMHSLVLSLMPSFIIRKRLDLLADEIAHDDLLLINEGPNSCTVLFDEEVRNACLFRGLPSHVDVSQMRDCLTNYLGMVDQVVQAKGRQEMKSMETKMFLLHLAAIRYHMKRHFD